ncbi:MAG TPA: carboxypeptidase-like regulatory domain-containing protein, partial [Chitinophagaceae bacterium]|nr:carboxypeptidase-like regulatory domain-containing protein [Chitinophagaceae bacterium]
MSKKIPHHLLLRCILMTTAMVSVLSLSALDVPSEKIPAGNFKKAPIDVTGRVTDSKNEPLAGATVTVKGSKKFVLTDANGIFTLKSVETNSTLVISYAGYTAKEVSLSGVSGPIDVQFSEQQNQLGEVVVVGYGTQKKKDLTGAVAQVKATQFENENPRSVQDMLRGNAPGLDVGFNATAKGGGALLVRGRGSLIASTSPLLVVDGVIYQGSLDDIN